MTIKPRENPQPAPFCTKGASGSWIDAVQAGFDQPARPPAARPLLGIKTDDKASTDPFENARKRSYKFKSKRRDVY